MEIMNELELRRRLYVPNFEYWNRQCSKEYFSDRELKVRTLENGLIVPPIDDKEQLSGGVFDSDLKFFAGCDNLYADKRDSNFSLESEKNFDRKSIVKSDEEVIFGGGLTCHFGHFISECLSRMWYLIENRTGETKVAFLNLYHWKISRWVYKFFDLLGLPEDRILIVDKPTQFKSIVVPDQSAYIKEDYTGKFMLPYMHIASRIRPFSGVQKLFLTRGRDLRTKNYIANQEYFEEFYRSHGYQVVAPEKLSITDQIALITGASEVATYLGTLSHWSLFCRPKVKFTMITRFDEFRSRQCMINQATGGDWYIVSAARNFLYAEQGAGVNLLGPTEQWQSFVRDHFGEEITIARRFPPEIVDDYISHWCKYFSLEQHLQQRIDSLKAVYNRGTLAEAQLNSERPLLCCETHVARRGWLPVGVDGEKSGALDQKLSLQALKLYFLKPYCDVLCSVYYPKEGWTEPVGAKKIAGSVGKAKAIYGLSIRLERDDQFDVLYRVHNYSGKWSPWARNGDRLISQNQMLNGVQIKLVPR